MAPGTTEQLLFSCRINGGMILKLSAGSMYVYPANRHAALQRITEAILLAAAA
jgi:hypothetical protein